MIEYGHLIHRFGHLDGAALLAPMLRDVFPGRLALVSSFGAESAVLLHMAAGVDRTIPVIFLETGKLFPETLAYRDRLIAHLGLEDVRSITPDPAALEDRDLRGDLHASAPDACCHVRKVAPLERALAGLHAWVTGRKRFHGGARSQLATLEAAGARLKINPLARWSHDDLARYMETHALPPHPLEARGYTSIGCAPCTQPPAPAAPGATAAGPARPRPNAAFTGPTTASPCAPPRPAAARALTDLFGHHAAADARLGR